MGPRLSAAWAAHSNKESANGSSPTPAQRLASLEKAHADAVAAKASCAVLDALAEDIKQAKLHVQCSKPFGARLDSAQARLRRALAKATAAEEAVAEAIRRNDEAKAEVKASEAAIEALSAEVPKVDPHAPFDVVIRGVRELLQSLESSRLVDPVTNTVPEKISQG